MTDIISVASSTLNIERLKLAVERSVTLAKKHECNITIFVAIKKNLDKTILADVVDKDFVKGLVKNNPSIFNENISVELISIKSHPLSMEGIVLALWSNSQMLEQLDEYLNLKSLNALVVHFENSKEVDEWCKRIGANEA